MKILLNLVAFTVITIGAVYGYLTIASSTQEISTEDHSGHDHAGHSHAAEVQVAGAPATPLRNVIPTGSGVASTGCMKTNVSFATRKSRVTNRPHLSLPRKLTIMITPSTMSLRSRKRRIMPGTTTRLSFMMLSIKTCMPTMTMVNQ